MLTKKGGKPKLLMMGRRIKMCSQKVFRRTHVLLPWGGITMGILPIQRNHDNGKSVVFPAEVIL